MTLSLERAHWETRVWLDSRLIGTNASLSTPHEYDLGEIAAGAHTLTVRVDNRMIVNIGENSHARWWRPAMAVPELPTMKT